MNKYFKSLGLSMVLVVSMGAVQGCVPLMIGAVAGAGSVAFARGVLIKNMDYSVSEMHAVTLEALKELGIFVKDDVLERHMALINAEFDDGKKVRIDMTALTEKVLKIKIRVGVFGDHAKSYMILNAIQKRL